MKDDPIYAAQPDELRQALCRITFLGEQTKLVPSVLLLTHWSIARSAPSAQHANDRASVPVLCTPEEMSAVLAAMQQFDDGLPQNTDEAMVGVLFQRTSQRKAVVGETTLARDRAKAFLEAVQSAIDDRNTSGRAALERMRLQIRP
jgi:hypothetical protein